LRLSLRASQYKFDCVLTFETPNNHKNTSDKAIQVSLANSA
jgi:hypothetical protein